MLIKYIFIQERDWTDILSWLIFMFSGEKVSHDDVIKWKYFPRYWPFVREIHRSPVNSPHKGQWRGALIFYLIRLNNRLSKQSRGWWFETASRSLCRHCKSQLSRGWQFWFSPNVFNSTIYAPLEKSESSSVHLCLFGRFVPLMISGNTITQNQQNVFLPSRASTDATCILMPHRQYRGV